jgi:pyrroloquinoline quinone biosynthesis protein E
VSGGSGDVARSSERPYTLVAELTYRCPLRCVYCSNPVVLGRVDRELDTSTWKRVFREAEALGVLQLNLTGGEPLLRDDLEELVAEGRRCDLYMSLITSGMPLDQARLERLAAAGLDAVQLSFQDTTAEGSVRISGRDAMAEKRVVAGWVRALKLPLTVNVVLHRENLERIDEIIALGEEVDAQRLELANTQYLGWALVNRERLMPSTEALDRARLAAAAARERLRGKMEVLFVLPDYFADRPRACMDGWARRYLIVAPDGVMVPCQNAHTLPLTFENVRDRSVGDIWENSEAFNAFRGETWMKEPCRSCDRRTVDFGGCRCQAFHLTGDAAATDPACGLSPQHSIVEEARTGASSSPTAPALVYRRLPTVT